jgi:hypothetical protein
MGWLIMFETAGHISLPVICHPKPLLFFKGTLLRLGLADQPVRIFYFESQCFQSDNILGQEKRTDRKAEN